jgi:5-methylcytosine-specific restriction endonuclease McrA
VADLEALRARNREACRRYRAKHPERRRASDAAAQRKRRAKYSASVEHAIERAIRRDGRLNSAERAARKKVVVLRASYAWRVRNPERHRLLMVVGVTRYRARKIGASGVHSADQWQARWDYFAGRCWMCGEGAIGMDHVLPMSKGGPNWASNLRPACGPCNSRKNNRTLEEVASLGRRA